MSDRSKMILFLFIVLAATVGIVTGLSYISKPKAETVDTENGADIYLPSDSTYTAKRGDTYESIAQQYNLDAKTLETYNLDREIKPGTIIELPPDLDKALKDIG